MENLTDEACLQRYLAGDPSAFEALMSRYGSRVFGYMLRSVRDRGRAEDLVQEVFLRVVRRASSFEGRSKVSTWIYTIARNLLYDETRKARHRRAVSLDEPLARDGEPGETVLDRATSPAPDPSQAVRDRRLRDALVSALATLPDEQREVFEMRQLQGLKFREIAKILGVGENTLKSRMRYALQALRVQLDSFADGFEHRADGPPIPRDGRVKA